MVSIIIPAFNRASLIRETLNSVLSQTYGNWECFVVDDGSTDRTVEVVREYTSRDNRFVLCHRPQSIRKGASPCRNFGLQKAKGDFIQFLDSDDLLHEKKFEEQLRIFRESPVQSIVTCRWGSFTISSNLRIKTKYHSYRSFKKSVNLLSSFGRYDEYFPPLAYLVPKGVIKKAGFWDETLEKNPNDDGEYFTRVILNSSSVQFCEKAEVYYRAGDENRLSLLDEPRKVRSALESWKMIHGHLLQYPKVSRLYVGNGLRGVVERIGESYPEILKEYGDFVKDYSHSKKWYHKLLRR